MSLSVDGRSVRERMEYVGRRVGRDGRHATRAAWLALRELVQSDDLTFASSIAYYALVSLSPLLLLLFYFFGRVSADPVGRTALIEFVLQYFPQGVDFITTQLEEVQEATFSLGATGALVMVWSALGVFRAISSAVDHAWNVETNRSFLGHQVLAFLMLVAAALVMLSALLVVSMTEVMASTWFGQLASEVPGLEPAIEAVLQYPATLLLIGVVGLILYFVPNTNVRVSDIWIGAVLTGVLWRLALAGFSWYLGVAAFSVHGSVGAIVVFLLWVYVSATILLYGVEFSAAFANLRRVEVVDTAELQ